MAKPYLIVGTDLRDEPEDYEPCGECGFDHSYEPEDAAREHRKESDRDLDTAE